MVWWRTRDSLGHLSQLSDCYQNETVFLISLLFEVLTVVKIKAMIASYRNFSPKPQIGGVYLS